MFLGNSHAEAAFSPELMETFTFVPIEEEHREVLSRWAFDMIPLSKNKVETIQYCATEDYWTYYIPFMVYHINNSWRWIVRN